MWASRRSPLASSHQCPLCAPASAHSLLKHSSLCVECSSPLCVPTSTHPPGLRSATLSSRMPFLTHSPYPKDQLLLQQPLIPYQTPITLWSYCSFGWVFPQAVSSVELTGSPLSTEQGLTRRLSNEWARRFLYDFTRYSHIPKGSTTLHWLTRSKRILQRVVNFLCCM